MRVGDGERHEVVDLRLGVDDAARFGAEDARGGVEIGGGEVAGAGRGALRRCRLQDARFARLFSASNARTATVSSAFCSADSRGSSEIAELSLAAPSIDAGSETSGDAIITAATKHVERSSSDG